MFATAHNILDQETDYEAAATVFKALAHPIRLRLLCRLLKQRSTQTQLARNLDLPQSTVAQHLSVLRNAEVVAGERSGTEITLYVHNEKVTEIFRVICGDS